jgi:hypothetical protein
LFHAIQDRADQVGEADRCRHVGVELPDDPAEIVEMMVGKRQRLQLASHFQVSCLGLWHEFHW